MYDATSSDRYLRNDMPDRIGPTKRRRARRACLSCRARKIRCDVVLCGTPCTNCRLDDAECLIKPRQRKWPGVVAWAPQPGEGRLEQNMQQETCEEEQRELISEHPTPNTSLDAEPQQLQLQKKLLEKSTQVLSPLGRDDATYAPSCLEHNLDGSLSELEKFLADLDEIPTTTDSEDRLSIGSKNILSGTMNLPAHVINGPARVSPFSPSIFDKVVPIRTSPICADNFSCQWSKCAKTGMFVLYSCYPFIAANTAWHLHQTDLIFLEQRGCLHLPKKPTLDEFVKQYYMHVHPILPLINELDFWTIYNAHDSPSATSKPISLFVFHAMLFLACPFVSQSTLESLGFLSVREARAELYSKAKNLFHFDGYRDDIACAQAALMLTYHSTSINDKINSYWLSTAVHFARSAGANQYETIRDDPKRKSMLKRLWWCCILRDRIMALGLRRPLHIQPSDFDFGLPGLVEDDIKDEIRGSRVYDPATKRVLVQLAASLCELAVALNDVLMVCYPLNPNSDSKLEDPAYDPLMLKDYISTLDKWYETAVAKFQIPTRVFGMHESLTLFTNAIYIYYHTARACLCHHAMLLLLASSAPEEDEFHERWHTSEEVDESLQSITKSLTELEQRDLTKYLPNTFVAFSALPLVWRNSNGGLLRTDSSRDAEQDLRTLQNIFEGFSQRYEITDSVLQCIVIKLCN